jgi:Tol biopolymer transport system component
MRLSLKRAPGGSRRVLRQPGVVASIVLATVAGLGLVAWSYAAQTTAVPNPDGTVAPLPPRLAFSSQHGTTIYLRGDHGSLPAPLTDRRNAPIAQASARGYFAPVFVSYITGTDGDIAQGQRGEAPWRTLVTDDFPDADPDMSADGTKIAYSSKRGDSWDIYQVTLTRDGVGPVTALTSGRGDDRQPSWSPDGTKLVFSRTSREDPNGDLYVLTVATGQITRLTGDPGVDADPAWSPNGASIAFTTSRFGGTSHVATMPAAGGAATDLTVGRTPAWSQDSTVIAFVDTRQDPSGDVYGIRVKDGKVEAVSADPGSAEDQPAFTVGNSVYFTGAVTDGAIERSIRAVHQDGSRPATLVNNPAPQGGQGPAWAPNGKRLAYTSANAAQGGIWLVDADGGNARRVFPLATGKVYSDPVWSPDGRYLAFSERRQTADPERAAIVVLEITRDGAGAETATQVDEVPCGGFNAPVPPSPPASPSPDRDPEPITVRGVPVVNQPAGMQAPEAPGGPAAPDEAGSNTLVHAFAPEDGGECMDRHPAFAPDGRTLAFSRGMLIGSNIVSRIYTVSFDPARTTNRFGTPTAITPADPDVKNVRSEEGPSWSPNGSRLVYSVRRETYATSIWEGLPVAKHWELATRGSGGASPATILDSRTAINPANDLPLEEFEQPAWSPDNTKVVFAARKSYDDPIEGGVSPADMDLFSANVADGSALTSIYGQPGDDLAPDYQPAADLVATLAAAPPGILLQRTSEVTLTVQNAAYYAATNARARLTVAAGLTVQSIEPSTGTCDQTALTCALGTMDPNARVTVKLRVLGNAVGAHEITATASQDRAELDTVDDTARTTVTVDSADISVAVDVSPPQTFVGGSPITVRYTVRNTGTGSTGDVRFTATLPAVLPIQSVTVTATGGPVPACPAPTDGCDLGPFSPERQVVITVVLVPAVGIVSAAVGEVTAPESTGDESDNRAQAAIRVDTADVGITARALPTPGYIGGDPIIVRYTVTNIGTGQSVPVSFKATLPAQLGPHGAVIVSANAGPAPACPTPTTGCDLGIFPPGKEVVVDVALNPAVPMTGVAVGEIGLKFESPGAEFNNRAQTPVQVVAPSITVTPDVGKPGFVPTITGTNFPPGALVSLRWDRGVTAWNKPVTVDAAGNFRTSMIILHNDVTGTRAMVASHAAGQPNPGPKFGPARDTFLVVPGSGQPDEWKYRR